MSSTHDGSWWRLGRAAWLLLALGALLAACAPGDRGSAADSGARVHPASSAAKPSGGASPLPFETGAAAGRSLVLITLDTTRADRIGCYGYPGAETPNLDLLAAEGVRFADVVTPVPMTLPAHASLLTGLDPPDHEVRANGEYSLGPEHTTLAEALAGAGYETAAFVSSFVLARRFGLAQGFDVYDDDLEAARGSAFEQQNERSAAAVTGAALAWVERRGAGGGRPFFLWVHYFGAHDPYEPPSPWRERHADSPYDGEIASVDAAVGRLLEGVAAFVPPERSVIVAVGDHGESLQEHAERYHSRSLYEGAIRVPLLIAAPGAIAAGGAVDDRVVGLVDLYPTLLDLLGVARPPGGPPLDGRSLTRTGAPSGASPGASSADEDRALYVETLNTYLDNGWAPLYALRRHTDKYIFAPHPEYYDLRDDPHEQVNLLAGESSAGASQSLAERLGDLVAAQPGIVEVARGRQEADPEVRARLEALGYLSGGGGPAAPGTDLPDPKDMLPLHEELLAARRALARGDLQEAARVARKLVQAAPRNRAALQLLGEAYARMGDLARAEQALRRHMEIRPGVGALVVLAQVMMQQGRFDEAVALLDAAAELDPLHGAVALARGDLQMIQGHPTRARALYEEAARVDPYRFAGPSRARIERLERSMGRR